MKLDIWASFENLSKKIYIILKSDTNNGSFTLKHFDIFDDISPNTFYKSCRENENTHFMFNNFFPKIASFMR
jgi:hypothetical protein